MDGLSSRHVLPNHADCQSMSDAVEENKTCIDLSVGGWLNLPFASEETHSEKQSVIPSTCRGSFSSRFFRAML